MKKKIILSFGILCLIILLQGSLFFWLLSSIREADSNLSASQLLTTEITSIQMQHYKWLQDLTLALYTGSEFSGSLDYTSCSLGKWLGSSDTTQNPDSVFQSLVKQIPAPHQAIHENAAKIIAALEANQTETAVALFHDQIIPNMEKTISALDGVIKHADGIADAYQADSATMNQRAIIFLISIVVASVLLSVLLAFLLIHQIIPPLKKLTAAADYLAVGDVSQKLEIRAKDELGHLAQAFQGIIDATAEQSSLVAKVAAGDLTVDIGLRSPQDILNQKLEEMVEQNNHTLNSIREVIGDINNGANSIAASAQYLATGATEQSSSTEELSATIGGISDLAKNTAAETKQLMQLSESMREAAQTGDAQMRTMVDAVQNIRSSSTNISSIIKVIEDIAFQTNILALNAAVEAARAGVHGRGFAVVAEEVRSLAARSAQAAKETTDLIQESMKKSTDGVEIANATSQSLEKIIAEVEQVIHIISEISQRIMSLDEASSQLNIGIGQVSEVVQQNSAASEQLAAASQSLQQMADKLDAQSAVYQLKNPAQSHLLAAPRS